MPYDFNTYLVKEHGDSLHQIRRRTITQRIIGCVLGIILLALLITQIVIPTIESHILFNKYVPKETLSRIDFDAIEQNLDKLIGIGFEANDGSFLLGNFMSRSSPHLYVGIVNDENKAGHEFIKLTNGCLVKIWSGRVVIQASRSVEEMSSLKDELEEIIEAVSP